MNAHNRAEFELFRKKFLFAVGVTVAIILAWRVRNILVLIFIAGVLGAAISPAVRRVQVFIRKYTRKRIPRGAAVLIVFVPFVLLLILLGSLTLPSLLSQSEELLTQFPLLLEKKLERLPGVDVQQVEASIRSWLSSVPLFDYLRSAAAIVTSFIAIIFLMAYMMLDAERLRNLFLLFFPAEVRASRRRTSRRISRRLSGWLGGQLLLAAIIGIATFVALVALDIPYAIPLAIIAAIGEMVPVIGPILGAVPAVSVALFQSDWQFWGVLIAAILIQQAENYLLVPRLLGKKVSVSPLAVFVAFLIGASLLGIVGALMAVPAVAIIQIVFEESFLLQRERRRNRERSGVVVRTDRDA